MAKLLGSKVGAEICEVLGLDPTNISKLDIHLHASDVARVDVERFLESTEVGQLRRVIEQYELKPKRS